MNSGNTALIVIDIINSCASERCEKPEWNVKFSKVRVMVPSLREFIQIYRRKVGGLIVFTNCVPWQRECLPENINELYTDLRVAYYSKDSSGFAEQFYQVISQKEEMVITKNSYDAFAGTDLEKQLKSRGIKYLVVTGIFGDGCVLATVIGGFSRGFNFVLMKDLIETTDDEVRQKLLAQLKDYTFPIMYGKTLTSQEFLQGWE